MRSAEDARNTAVVLLLLLVGAFLGLAMLAFLLFLPDQWADRAREPEDLYLSVFWILVSAGLGVLALRAAGRRWKSRHQ